MPKRRYVLALAALALACRSHQQYVSADVASQPRLVSIGLDGFNSYLIDPRTETCLLMIRANGAFATPVSCALLKRNVPEAAAHITWVADAAPAAP